MGYIGVISYIGYNLYILLYGIYWGELTHLLTIDPNFLGHPSMTRQTSPHHLT